MSDLRFTLLSDGSSDQVLRPVLEWLLRRQNVTRLIQSYWADLRRLRQPPGNLSERIAMSVLLYPCDLLFVHRDAEGISHADRKEEILEALGEHAREPIPTVCVVPVRMQEAWLLFDDTAIRRAAGNPSGSHRLDLPKMRDLERLPNPKELLYELLREASGLQGRRRKKFSVQTGARRVIEFMEDFSPLLELPAFQALDEDVGRIVRDNGWAEEG